MKLPRRKGACACGRRRAACICANVARGHVKAAKRAHQPDPTPRPCPNAGCGRTMRGGVCPGPDC